MQESTTDRSPDTYEHYADYVESLRTQYGDDIVDLLEIFSTVNHGINYHSLAQKILATIVDLANGKPENFIFLSAQEQGRGLGAPLFFIKAFHTLAFIKNNIDAHPDGKTQHPRAVKLLTFLFKHIAEHLNVIRGGRSPDAIAICEQLISFASFAAACMNRVGDDYDASIASYMFEYRLEELPDDKKMPPVAKAFYKSALEFIISLKRDNTADLAKTRSTDYEVLSVKTGTLPPVTKPQARPTIQVQEVDFYVFYRRYLHTLEHDYGTETTKLLETFFAPLTAAKAQPHQHKELNSLTHRVLVSIFHLSAYVEHLDGSLGQAESINKTLAALLEVKPKDEPEDHYFFLAFIKTFHTLVFLRKILSERTSDKMTLEQIKLQSILPLLLNTMISLGNPAYDVVHLNQRVIILEIASAIEPMAEFSMRLYEGDSTYDELMTGADEYFEFITTSEDIDPLVKDFCKKIVVAISGKIENNDTHQELQQPLGLPVNAQPKNQNSLALTIQERINQLHPTLREFVEKAKLSLRAHHKTSGTANVPSKVVNSDIETLVAYAENSTDPLATKKFNAMVKKYCANSANPALYEIGEILCVVAVLAILTSIALLSITTFPAIGAALMAKTAIDTLFVAGCATSAAAATTFIAGLGMTLWSRPDATGRALQAVQQKVKPVDFELSNNNAYDFS